MTKVRKKIGNIPINTIKQDLQDTVDASVTQMQQDVTDFIDEETAQYPEIGGAFKFQIAPEYASVETDSEGRMLGGRKADGTKFENIGFESAKVTTDSLTLSSEGMTEFQQALINSGFVFKDAGDYSDVITKKGENPVSIALPDCAILNILWDGDLTQLSKAGYSGQPAPIQKVNYDVKCQIEFFDGHGIYFKKTAFIGAQGNSSMPFAKKNISLKIFDTDDVEGKKKKWGKGDTFGIVFGDWVMQKSWHLKAYCTNIFRGEPVVGYQVANKIMESRGIFKDRPWKIGLLGDKTFASDSDSSAIIDDMSLQMDNGARCLPDGFPIVVYQNGTFYGVYSWQIKKDADNYRLDTDNPLNIHLDGELTNGTFWGGTIDWTQFEVRCPEGLKDINGDDYDGDNPKEIEEGDTKNAIVSLSQICAALDNAADDESRKAILNTNFDVDNIIDYIIFGQITSNYDGFSKNWQWVSYDGVKWFVCFYDLDGIFGCNFVGTFALPANSSGDSDYTMETIINRMSITKYVYSLYNVEVKTRYAELRNSVGITPNFIIQLIKKWQDRVGLTIYTKEYSKWDDAECNRDSIISDKWELVEGVYFGTDTYQNARTYTAGEECWAGYRKWKAKETIQGVYPFQKLGYRDNLYRLATWIAERFQLMDTYYNYSE